MLHPVITKQQKQQQKAAQKRAMLQQFGELKVCLVDVKGYSEMSMIKNFEIVGRWFKRRN